MTVELELWHVISLIITLISAFFVMAKLLAVQIGARITERFAAFDKAAELQKEHWDSRFKELLEQQRKESDGWARIERDLLTLKADLPTQYVRRDDYIRNQTVIEAKLDGLALKIENTQLRQIAEERSISR